MKRPLVKLSDAFEKKSHSHLDLDSNSSEEKAIDGNVKLYIQIGSSGAFNCVGIR